MAWLYLFLAGLLEVGWAIGLKLSEGLTRPGVTALTAMSIVGSMVLLGLAVRQLPIGSAYAVWTGIGTVGTLLVGIALLGESAQPAKLFCVALIVAGIAGLKMISE